MDIREDFLRERRKEEYQYQHFEFTTSILKAEVKETTMSVIEEAAGNMEQSLLAKFPPHKCEEIKSATRTLVEEYAGKTEECISSTEAVLDNKVFAIPSYILLPEDTPQIKQYSKEDVRQVEQELKELEKKIKQVNFMEAKLKEAVKLSEKTLKSHSKLPPDTSGSKSTSDFLKGMEKLQRKRIKVNEGRSYCFDALMDNSSSDSEENSIKQEGHTVEHPFETLVD